ncbi:hypothetical protein BN59_00093 [Legionella massiliensis]|uniref:Uncharacterized protein n=1 Tax=Legionella massiliensis TaxID=1034943 RepID=A0A078KVP2_9GAMM|nr:hypothetical protein [Legionella massiliensis]CDZ75834.1 hypothetical protein BN59_00093 [Legionella massiliensis]CEE11572.1 hypothetical protein BN1094_00093 [Legionella massiliensis]
MRKIQIERKLFELFGHKFFVFENFQDIDLDIDNKLIYKHDNQDALVDIFARNQFYSIWSDERRLNAGVICACEGDISMVVGFLKRAGFKDDSYSTFDCGLIGSNSSVLFLTSPETMQAFIAHLAVATFANKFAQSTFFGAKEAKLTQPKKSEITEA